MEHLLKKFDVFIFDWDGTLSTLGPVYAFNEKFSPLWKYKKKKYSKTSDMKGRDYNIKNRMRKTKIEGTLFARFVDLYFFLSRPKLQSGARAILDELKRNHKKVGLFTNGATWRIERELSHLGVSGYFEIIVSAQQIRAIKPNPIGLNTIIRDLNAKRGRVLYTGDMIDDIMMARYAKVHSCGITSGFSGFDRLKEAKPDYLFGSMEEFKKAL